MVEIVLVVLEAVLKACLFVLAVGMAAFFSHLLDPEPMPRIGRWPRGRGRRFAAPPQGEKKMPHDIA